jgi:hypothetical protein
MAHDEAEVTLVGISNREILHRLGLVVMRCGFAEAVIEDLIAGFLGAETTHVYTLTANINVSTRLEALRALAVLRLEQEHYAELNTLISELKVFVPLRNKLVHGFWTETNDPDVAWVSLTKSSGRLKLQCEYVNSLYLDWLGERFFDVSLKLIDFGNKHELLKGYSVTAA